MAGVARADGVDSVGAPTSGFATGSATVPVATRLPPSPAFSATGKLSATQR